MFREASDAAQVSMHDSLRRREIHRYALRKIPAGASPSSVLIELRGLSAGGSPLPILNLAMKFIQHEQKLESHVRWNTPETTSIGVWQWGPRAILELPDEHLIRNAIVNRQDLVVFSRVELNQMQFKEPKLIVEYVSADDLLWRKSIP